MSFWTDSKVVDDFTPEDRYFYLYLFTNPHTNLCGCYEVSLNQIASEVGYNRESVARLVERFIKIHNVIRYSNETKEMLLLNWHKYNWTKSDRFRKPLEREIKNVKDDQFRDYLTRISNGEKVNRCIDTVSEKTDTSCIDTVSDSNKNVQASSEYGIDTPVTVTVTNTNTNANANTNTVSHYSIEFNKTWEAYPRKREKAAAYKAYKARLKDFSEDQLHEAALKYAEECRRLGTEERFIKHGATFFGPSMPFTDYLAEDYRLPEEKKAERKPTNGFHNFDQRDYDFGELEKRWTEGGGG